MIKRTLVAFFLVWSCFVVLLALAPSPSSGRASDGSNLLQNPGFEEGTDPWLPDHSTTDFITVTHPYPVYSGDWAASLNRTDGVAGQIHISQDVEVVGGAFYTLSGWAYKNDSGFNSVKLSIEWRDAALQIVAEVESHLLTDDEDAYHRLCIPRECDGDGVQAPSNAATARIKGIAIIASPNPQTPVFFDEFTFALLALPTPTPTPTATSTPTSTSTPTPTVTSTSTPTSTPTPPLIPLLISEVLYDGVIFHTEGDEFVEIFNPFGEAVDLGLYRLGDAETPGAGEGEGMYRFPEGVSIPLGGTLVIAKDAGEFYERFGFYPDMEFEGSPRGAAVPDMIRDTSWALGNWGLNNVGDEVLLLGPDYQLVDSVAYKAGDSTAVGVRGTVSAPEPLSFQRVGEIDSDDMNTDFLVGVPNPEVVTEFPPAPPSPPEPIPLSGGMNAYFGDLHSHTTYSDGSGPPRYAYAVARANGLHFQGLSDYAYMLDEERWEGMQEEAQLAQVEGAFVALEGFEWTHQEAGHINAFGSEGFISRDDPEGDTLEEFYLWLVSQSSVVAQFNHPGPEGDFGGFAYSPQADEVIQLLEVGNGIGSDYRRFESEYLRSLDKGWRVGVANNSDTHTLNWGAETPHRTGVVAQALTRQNILAALQARRTFATEDSNFALALRAGESWMGSVVPFAETLSFAVEAVDLDGEGVTLTLFDGDVAVASQSFPQAISHSWAIEVPGAEGHFYFVKAEQPDGDIAYSSPIWAEATSTIFLPLVQKAGAPSEGFWRETTRAGSHRLQGDSWP